MIIAQRKEPGAYPEPGGPAGKGGNQVGVICRGKGEASVLPSEGPRVPSTGLSAHLVPPLLGSFKTHHCQRVF